VTDRLVVITDSELPSDGAEEAVLAAGGLRARRADARDEAAVVEAAAGASALLVQWAPITAAVLDALPDLRFISRYGIGIDMIDLDAASAHGVAVANTPDYCLSEVAAHTVALVLAATRSVVAHDRAVRAGEWAPVSHRAVRPESTTVAVLGAGRIGRRVCRALDALGFRVVAHDPYVAPEDLRAAGAEPVELAEALGQADVLSLHLPLGPGTAGLIDAAALAALPPGAVLVNTCRGGLVDEDALVAALRDGHLAGAALDVFAAEPLPPESPLRELDGVVLTPHAAWYSPDALAELPRRAAQQVVDFLAGRPVPAVLNAPSGEGAMR
jgi:D-3-phosphoglycerate dehydrogenase / 2-oxoglutarate reductase